VIAVHAPDRLEFEDGFADGDGKPMVDMPTTTAKVTIDATESGGARMTIASEFPSLEAMEQLVEMGMEEGMVQAIAARSTICLPGLSNPLLAPRPP
jgi:uncharacterized protein YndB with AHSA1/START domain